MDTKQINDASQLPPRLIAKEEGGKVRVRETVLYQQIVPTTEEWTDDATKR